MFAIFKNALLQTIPPSYFKVLLLYYFYDPKFLRTVSP